MELSDVICHPLCKIFETSLKTSCIPDDRKDAKISAIYKNGNNKLACNYRPISLTSIVCLSEITLQQSLSSADTPVSKQKCPYITGVPSSEGHNF